jgi:hypothetical protein
MIGARRTRTVGAEILPHGPSDEVVGAIWSVPWSRPGMRWATGGRGMDSGRGSDGAEMTTLETRETTQPPAGEKLKGRVALVTGSTRAVGTAIGRSLATRLGRREGVARVVHFLCAGAPFYITGRVWALNGSQEM